jgi:hypothetical protein
MAWFGGYEVKVTPKSEIYAHDIYGAFVNIVVDCSSEAEFRERASQALFEGHYEILGVADVMEIDLNDTGLTDAENSLLMEQFRFGHLVAFGHFQTYPKDRLDA